MAEQKIARATVRRLPLYYQALLDLEQQGVSEISSMELAEILGTKSEQIRKDLTLFGKFGIKGLGYEVRTLKNKIANIIGLQNNFRLAIIGMGNLGVALANYQKIQELGYVIAALFDIDKQKIGDEINGIRIYDFTKFIPISRRKLIDIGVIAVPDEKAQIVADILVAADVRGIWNFTTTKLEVPSSVSVVDENFAVGLGALSFYLNQDSRYKLPLMKPKFS